MLGQLRHRRRTRPRAMPLAMMTMKTKSMGLLIFYGYGALLCGPLGRWELRYHI